MDAFDADVLIYAAVAGHPLGRRVLALFPEPPADRADEPLGIGSVLLVPELLSKPIRDDNERERGTLEGFLARLDLLDVSRGTADLAVSLGAAHRLDAADAIHLATAVMAGADRFLTNNRADFPRTLSEIDVTYPEDLPA